MRVAAEEVEIDRVQFREAAHPDFDNEMLMIDRYTHDRDEEAAEGAQAKKAKTDKKPLKVSNKVAPLVASLNEQANSKGQYQLSEQEQLQRKNKKKATQVTRKQK